MPGTCRLSGMKTTGNNPHGFAPATTGMGYTLTVQPASAANTYTVTLGGTGTFTGVVLFAQDNANGTRFGSFSNIPTGYALLTTCGDVNPASNTLGHNSATPKSLPVSFTWSDAGYTQPWMGVFSAIVMTATETMWYTTPPVLFASTGGVTPSMSAAASPAAVSSDPMLMSPAAATTTTAAAASPAAGGGGMPSNSSNMTMSTSNMTMSTSNMTMSMDTSMTGSAMNPTGTAVAADANMTTAAPALSGSARVEAPLSLGLVVASLVLFFSL